MIAYDRRQKFMELKERAEEITAKYNWYDRNTYPYSFPVKVKEILKDCEDYDDCTSGSQAYLYTYIKGLVEILEKWERDYNSRRTVRVNGKIKNLMPEYIEMLIEEGIEVEYI